MARQEQAAAALFVAMRRGPLTDCAEAGLAWPPQLSGESVEQALGQALMAGEPCKTPGDPQDEASFWHRVAGQPLLPASLSERKQRIHCTVIQKVWRRRDTLMRLPSSFGAGVRSPMVYKNDGLYCRARSSALTLLFASCNVPKNCTLDRVQQQHQ